jgi:hypothetical protein
VWARETLTWEGACWRERWCGVQACRNRAQRGFPDWHLKKIMIFRYGYLAVLKMICSAIDNMAYLCKSFSKKLKMTLK